jgi:phenylalanyl-tRNA synthetase alpha chain
MNVLVTLQQLEREAMARLAALQSKEELDTWRSDYLGRKGALTDILRQLGSLPPAERPLVGRQANEVKQRLGQALAAAQKARRAEVRGPALDVTRPGRPPQAGRLHPITATIRRMRAAFAQMGFQVYEGRDVESGRIISPI